MDYYVNATADAIGNHGQLHEGPAEGRVCLPEALRNAYLSAKGFVTLTADAGRVLAIETNTGAKAAYESSHPENAPEPTEPDAADAIWAELAAAYREGVQSA